ncbi:MAG TPA: hypothetical protein VMN36_00350 [Verrucomicrobiales bacterium]|nr:hypothetical protein [Verrucomicrobiales bacterium]
MSRKHALMDGDFWRDWDVSAWVNGFEIVLWTVMAAIALHPRFQQRYSYRRFNLPLAAAFGAFALSDYLELHTGAWHRPWPLALLKGGCVVAIGGAFALLLRPRKDTGRVAGRAEDDNEAGA